MTDDAIMGWLRSCKCQRYGCMHKQAADEIELLRAVVDALTARPFRGTSSERRDRMYGSDWEPVHDALDALEARCG